MVVGGRSSCIYPIYLGIDYNVIYLHFLVAKSQNPSATLVSFLVRTPRHSDVAFLGACLGAFVWRRGDRNC